MLGLKKCLTSLLLGSLLSSGVLLAAVPVHVSAADPANVDFTEVVTLGADLSQSQKDQMFSTFGVSEDKDGIKVLEVNNQEERQYLKGLVPDKQIGSRSISSVYVKILDSGSGINVKTKNITFVNEQAYANALVTAEIKDADVYAAAPFPVSGTAALTGLFKAYETATGKDIPEEAKKVATEELVTTSEIGEETGEEKGVSELVSRVKEQVVEENLTDPEEIKKVIVDVAKDMDIDLTPEQIDRIVELMQKISGLDLDIGTLKNQLEDVRSKLKDYFGGEESSGAWQKVVDFFTGLWNTVKGYF